MGYISLLAVAAIIAFMAYFGWHGHFQSPAAISKNTQASLKEQGVDSSNYQGLLSSVKTRLDASSQVESDRAKELENLK